MFDDEAGDGPGDDSGFWDDMPTSRLDRLSAMRTPRPGMPSRAPRVRRAGSVGAVGSRHHDDTGSVPVMSGSTSGPAGITGRMRTVTDHVDPLLRRMGVVAIVVALAVPVAMAVRHGSSSASPLAPEATSAVADAAGAVGVADPVVTDAAATSASPGSKSTLHTAAKRTVATARAEQKAATTTAEPTGTTVAAADVAVAAQAQQASTVSRNCRTYKIVKYDGWYVIAKKAGVTVRALLAANHATLATKLYPGRLVCLPAKAVVANPTTTTVKKTTVTTAKPAPKVTTTTAKPAPPAHVYTRAEVIQIIRDVWPDDLEDHAIAIATRESNLVPTAHNSICYGLFQIYFNVHKSWLATIGVTSPSQLYDPRVNAYAALVMYVRAGGWGPWA